MSDLISRQSAITTAVRAAIDWHRLANPQYSIAYCIGEAMRAIPSAQPEKRTDKRTESHACDCISRQAAIEAIEQMQMPIMRSEFPEEQFVFTGMSEALRAIKDLPSAQPEQRCVNCGRTANNGGWYEDGRTRCPIEEHYALPKDGYCHLWEKRKDWEDDYVKRPEEGEK